MPGMRTKNPEFADNRLLAGLHFLDKSKPVQILDFFLSYFLQGSACDKDVADNPAETDWNWTEIQRSPPAGKADWL